jgi:hypothetical protein
MFGNINKINNIRGMYVLENNFYTCNFLYGGGPNYDRNLERKEWNSRNIELFEGGRRSKKRRMRIRRKKVQPFHLYY